MQDGLLARCLTAQHIVCFIAVRVLNPRHGNSRLPHAWDRNIRKDLSLRGNGGWFTALV